VQTPGGSEHLGCLHQNRRPFLEAGAAAADNGYDRQLAAGGKFESSSYLLPDDAAYSATQKAEIDYRYYDLTTGETAFPSNHSFRKAGTTSSFP
jgi:hypothetical protein